MTTVLPAPLRVHAGPTIDWAEFYRGWQARGAVPDSTSTVIDRNHAVFQAMYLDLAEVRLTLLASGFDPPLVTLVADVLTVPTGTGWTTSGVLQVRARRVQSESGLRVNLDLTHAGTGGLLLYCTELVGPVRVVTVQDGAPPHVFVVEEPPPDGGVHVHLVDGTPTRTDVSWAQGVPVELPAWFERAMRTQFIFATLLYDTHPALALSQLAWLKAWTGFHDELVGLFLQSSSLLALLSAQVEASTNGTMFVPYLSRAVYGDLARAYVAEAAQYEADYRALQTQTVVDDHFLTLARSLLANTTYESEYATQLLAEARRNFDHAVAATDQAEKTLSDAQLQAKLLAIDFEEVGVPAWQREQIVKAVIDLATAVVTFGVGIGAMLAGDPAAGGAAVAGAIEGAKAAEQAAKTGSELARLAAQLKEAMEKLKTIAEALDKVVELAKTVLTVVGDIGNAGDYVAAMRELGGDVSGADLTATYDWQVYQQTSDAALEGPVSQGIAFAAELQLACDAIAVYGQARAAAQVATIQAGQRYAEISLKKQLAQRQQAELAAYVDSLERGAAPPAQLLQRFYELYLDAKTGLFTAAQGYRDSYYYWALRSSVIRPAIVDGVDALDTGLKNLTSIVLDNQSALEHFDPPPQQLKDKRVVVSDTRVLDALRATGEAAWQIGTDAAPFAGYDRVRLTRVRVWLDGARVPDGGSVGIRMSTQGGYQDRFEGRSYQFTSKPLVREFQYRVARQESGPPDWRFPDGTYGYIEVDGIVDDEVRYAYFQPTPFAHWQISVRGSGVDLSGLEGVVMEFAGSVIPQLGRGDVDEA